MVSFIPESSSTATAGHQPSCHTQSGVLPAIACEAFMVFRRAENTNCRNSGMFGAHTWLKQNNLLVEERNALACSETQLSLTLDWRGRRFRQMRDLFKPGRCSSRAHSWMLCTLP